MIQQSLNEKLQLLDSPSFQRWEERAKTKGDNWSGEGDGQKFSEWKALIAEQKRQQKEEGKFTRKVSEEQLEAEGLRGPVDLKGKDMKVIVKVSLERRSRRVSSRFRSKAHSTYFSSSHRLQSTT